ncbi:potassium channel protein [Phototrophicus methaneseepsis]|uniref:Potassium channel protein n=1 Tax=Phototrophicus methaneseepsis TaxID=2710758 RepID=A0A7S8E8V8_9CHLR|nr:potassium channel protein [Phototrophicus methaneseepsis]QPC82505.1 potassium channel protein [Phototrophicus methaneseepsis]
MIEHFVHIVSRIIQSIPPDPLRRLQLTFAVLLLLTIIAVVGYMVIENMVFIDALYMTVITISTVGFGEVQTLSPTGRIFTSFLIVLGISIATTAASNAISILLGERWEHRVKKRQLEQALKELQNHYIVCGYGRMGRQIAADLKARDEKFVIVDAEEELEERLIELQLPYVIGDATHDDVLIEAGIKRARGLVAALTNDPANVLTVLSARELKPDIFIIARVTRMETESKLRVAGANRVINPYQIGGHRMALTLLRPVVHDFLDQIFHFGEGRNIDIGQIIVHEKSTLAGQTIGSSDLRSEHQVNILGIRKANDSLVITPNPNERIELDDTLIVIGPPEAIYMLERQNLVIDDEDDEI